MIDVPVRVKDALRSGDYKKECKIDVLYDSAYYDSDEWTWTYETKRIDGIYWYMTSHSVDVSEMTKRIKVAAYFSSYEEEDMAIWIDGTKYPLLDYGFIEGNEAYFTINFTPPENTTSIYLEVGIRPKGVPHFAGIDYVEVDSGRTIDNNYLISESVKIDERMCSDSNLKFGLCEGSSIEFQYFDFPNIRGQHIIVNLDIQYKNEVGDISWFTIPMGQFDVDECSRQAHTGIYKATAYNRLKSDYLNVDAKSTIEQMLIADPDHELSLREVLTNMLSDYSMLGEGWIPQNLKIYCSDTTARAVGDTQIKAWKKVSGSWVECTAGSTPPTSSYLTQYKAYFYLLPEDESGTTTTSYYKYTVNFLRLHSILKQYLMYFYDIQNVVAVSVDGTPFGVDTTPSGYIGPIIKTWSEYMDQSVGEFRYKPAGESWKTKIISSESSSFTTGEISGDLPYIWINVAVTGSDSWAGSGQSVNPDPLIAAKIQEQFNAIKTALTQTGCISIVKKDITPIEEKRLTLDNLDDISSAITLRDLQSAIFEMNCQYGKLDRISDLFAGIELNNSALYPRDNLYPADTLYPEGMAESGYPSMYNKLWADEGNVRSFKNLIITYKSTEVVDGQTREVEKTLQRTVNANGTDDYIMDDNWLFKNLVWTDAQVGDYADAMVTKMQNIRWFPFEMWCAGLPYLEAGDEIEIQMKEGAYKSYVLRRTLSGIQNLQDEMINGTLDIF